MAANPRLDLDRSSGRETIRSAVSAWVDEHVPASWRQAAAQGRAAIRAVRSPSDYEAWYLTFASSGLAVATWPVIYGGLDLKPAQARIAEGILAPYNLGRLNPLGLNNTAPALFAHGTEEQRLRFLPPLVRNEERWCQLFSEPGAGSDLASLATRAIPEGDDWVLTGQKVWTTWADVSDFAICLARTDPTVPKRKGITYFLVDLHRHGVEVHPLRHMGGVAEFNQVFLEGVRIPDFCRVGAVNDGWRVASASLAGERQMVAGAGSGGVDRIGGSGVGRVIDLARQEHRTADSSTRQRLARAYGEERIRAWTNQRVRATAKAGEGPGPAASVGKLHQAELNQDLQMLATDLLGSRAAGWPAPAAGNPDQWASHLPYEVRGMLRSRANTIEAGTTEVNRNIVAERVLGLPREPDPWATTPWQDTPRS
jgi:alkylation response protein AidB-like acyl-CoA dehydrogenase